MLGLNRDGLLRKVSRRGRVVELWAALKSLGSEGCRSWCPSFTNDSHFRELLGTCFLLNDVVFNQVLVDVGRTPMPLLRPCERVGKPGPGPPAGSISPCCASACSWVTSKDDIARTVQAMVRCRNALTQDRA